MAKKTLSPVVSAKYKLVGIDPGVRNDAKFGRLDFTSMDIATADLLFANKYKHLELREQPKPKEKSKGKLS